MENQNTSSQANNEYFNIIVSGLGYVKRIRTVNPNNGNRKGESFLACTVAAMVGPKDKVDYRYFDVRVSGKEAQEHIQKCVRAANDGGQAVIEQLGHNAVMQG